jgi:hypothetical protein
VDVFDVLEHEPPTARGDPVEVSLVWSDGPDGRTRGGREVRSEEAVRVTSVDEALELLPDRDLTMDEGLTVMRAFPATDGTRISYDTDEGETRVWMILLRLEDGRMVSVSRSGGEWSAEVWATDVRDSEFYEAVDEALRDLFGKGLEGGEWVPRSGAGEEEEELLERFEGVERRRESMRDRDEESEDRE